MKTARMLLLLALAAVFGVSLIMGMERRAEREYDDAVQPYQIP